MDSDEEKRLEGKIIIRKPKDERAEGLILKNPALLASFVTLIIGKPGSGKSHLLFELIMNKTLYFKKFDKILFLTPSKLKGLGDFLTEENWVAWLNVAWLEKKFKEYMQEFQREFEIKSRSVKKLEENPEFDDIDKVLQVEKEQEENTQKKNHKNILVIIDDLASSLTKASTDQAFISLFLNRRNIIPNCTISYFIVTQKFSLIPTAIRSAANGVIFFSQNANEMKKIFDEMGAEISNIQRIHLSSMLKSEKYSFVFLKVESGEIYFNFKKFF